MGLTLSSSLAGICRERRADLDATQHDVAHAIGISRSHYAAIERGRTNPSIALVDRIGEALGIRFDLTSESTVLVTRPRVRDAVHARCVAYVARRLESAGWVVDREVAILDERYRGWIDVLAYHPVSRTLLIIEVKTTLEDVGRLERQMSWYAAAVGTAIRDDWKPSHVVGWALLLASVENDLAPARLHHALGDAFPERAPTMRKVAAGERTTGSRGLALIDPRTRRRDWLIPTRADGRRTPMPYLDRAGAARILGL